MTEERRFSGDECPDCKGTRKYVGFDSVEPCKTCEGAPEEELDDRVTEPIDVTTKFCASPARLPTFSPCRPPWSPTDEEEQRWADIISGWMHGVHED